MPTHVPVANLSSLNERPQAALRSTFNEGDLRHASDVLPQPLRSAVQYNQNLQHVRHYIGICERNCVKNLPYVTEVANGLVVICVYVYVTVDYDYCHIDKIFKKKHSELLSNRADFSHNYCHIGRFF